MADERLSFEADSPWKGEHYFRYDEVVKHIGTNDTVLDIACGEGYGTFKIASHTSGKVFGCDVSAEAVSECREQWKKDNLSYQQMDGTNLEFESGFFDTVVSFETIEHTTEYLAMLRELNRVAKDGSNLFISTPNIVINSPSGTVHNPFHTQEWTYDELNAILSNVFDEFKIYGQKYNRFEKKGASQLGSKLEWLFTRRLIRKTPLSIQNTISNAVNNKPFYPQPDDFILVDDIKEIVKCQTFFCICKKKKI